MSDQLLPGPVRRAKAAQQAEMVQAEADYARRHPWRAMSADAKMSILSVLFLLIGGLTVVLSVGLLVGILVSPVIGILGGLAVGGLTLYVAGIMLGFS